LNLTLLPALITLARPPGTPERQLGVRLTLIDNYVLGHRRLVLGVGAAAALICAVRPARRDFQDRSDRLQRSHFVEFHSSR
jgi:hypothetical protein